MVEVAQATRSNSSQRIHAARLESAGLHPQKTENELKMHVKQWHPRVSVHQLTLHSLTASASQHVLACACCDGQSQLQLLLLLPRTRGLPHAGFIVLCAYGLIPTLQPAEASFARVYAVYGGVFVVMSYGWGWIIDGDKPDIGDCVGAAVALAGVMICWFWPRKALTDMATATAAGESV